MTKVKDDTGVVYFITMRCPCRAGEVLQFSIAVDHIAPRSHTAAVLRDIRREMRDEMQRHEASA